MYVNVEELASKELQDNISGYGSILAIYLQVTNLGIPADWIHYVQLKKALSSALANLAEGYGRTQSGKAGYKGQFLAFAVGSLYETVAWLDIALVEKVINLDEHTNITSNLLTGIKDII